MKNQFVRDLKEGDMVNSMFAVKYKKPPREYKSKSKEGEWFEIRVSDKTGEITAKYWGDDVMFTNKIYKSFDKDDVIFMRGRVNAYGTGIEILIEPGKIRKCVPEEYDVKDFVDVVKKDVEAMMSELMEVVNTIEEPYNTLLHSFFGDNEFSKEFKKAPAAMHRHQNYVGGLLEHTLNVVKICERIHDIHPGLDYHLLITGALLHDIGKTKEMKVSTSIDISEEGMLLGHITIGAEMLTEKIKKLEEFPERIKLKLIHIILSHHGRLEYGSPKTPQFPEAHAVYFADEIDAKVDYTLRLKEEAETEDPWIWKRDLGHIYLR